MLGAVLGGIGVLSSLLGSQSQSQGLENQAVSQEYAARETLLSGRSQANLLRRQADAMTGAQVTAAAGSGVQVDTGSVLDVIEDTAYSIELDALTIESDAKRQAEAQRKGAASSRSAKPSGVSTLLGAFGAGASGYATGLSING
jgi:hypothetical protein